MQEHEAGPTSRPGSRRTHPATPPTHLGIRLWGSQVALLCRQHTASKGSCWPRWDQGQGRAWSGGMKRLRGGGRRGGPGCCRSTLMPLAQLSVGCGPSSARAARIRSNVPPPAAPLAVVSPVAGASPLHHHWCSLASVAAASPPAMYRARRRFSRSGAPSFDHVRPSPSPGRRDRLHRMHVRCLMNDG